METKYYTPKIEEFYPGFEYEESNNFLRWTIAERPDLKWENKIFNFQEWIIKCHTILLEGDDFIRVKYLDREDIESLGFTLEYTKTTDYYKQEVYNKSKYIVEIVDYEPYKLSIFDRVLSTSVFVGTIKNKSEFKKLIEQLGVI
jgi:hypothetical protein